jgi:hypothetical protein
MPAMKKRNYARAANFNSNRVLSINEATQGPVLVRRGEDIHHGKDGIKKSEEEGCDNEDNVGNEGEGDDSSISEESLNQLFCDINDRTPLRSFLAFLIYR